MSYEEFKKIRVFPDTAFLCRPAPLLMKGNIPENTHGYEAVVMGQDVVAGRREMLSQPDCEEFKKAEFAEVANMIRNKVYKWVRLPKGKRVIGSKFTYKQKRDKNGKIIQHKARLVAHGFKQQQGINYVDTSAPVAGVTGFRMIVCITLNKGWNTHSWDVDSAFLHCELEEEIYMKQPHCFMDPLEDGKVLLLLKTIYGLKQAAHAWHGLLAGTF
jgi:hypothetical protein